MLGDTAEKPKNPLKKAMRRRNAKTVQFAPPTYVEASDYDYSSDEGDGELFGGPEPKQVQQQQQAATQNAEPAQDENLQVQPLKVNGVKKEVEVDARSSSEASARREGDGQRASEEDVDRPLDPKVTRNGTLRNTDSFFKDENTETRKITLTPNLLRDDSSTSTTGSRERERGPSLESLEKNGFADKVKDDKKKKEKKSGMLSGLFKRKDKKGKPDSMDSDIEKPDDADRSSPQSKPSEEFAERQSAERQSAERQSAERSSAEQGAAPAPLRQSSKGKLQKSLRNRDDSPQKTKGILKTDNPIEAPIESDVQSDEVESKPAQQQATPTMRLVSPEQESENRPSVEERSASSGPVANPTASRNPFSSIMKPQQEGEVKREKVTKAKQRVQLDDFDSDESSDPFADPDAQEKPVEMETSEPAGRLSESPVHVSAADAQPLQKESATDREKEPDPQQPPGLSNDSSSQETSSPISTPTPDDSPMKTIPENSTVSTFRSEDSSSLTHNQPLSARTIPPPSRPAPIPIKHSSPSPPVSSESTMLPAWSDASLRAYLDDGSEIRDMLVVINDTTGVLPVGPEHPFMKDYLAEETKTMADLSSELDGLLQGLMDKNMKRAGSAQGARDRSRSRSRSKDGKLAPMF
jgi:hypothetical protein